MFDMVFNFLYTHFFEILVAWLVALFSKKLIKDMGKDRAEIIQTAVATAMYWAEQQFGIATGQLKWEKAWRKIRELLDHQGIKLTDIEEDDLIVLMESYIPEINATTYQSMPLEEIEKRGVYYRPTKYNEAIEYLRKKYVDQTKEQENEPSQDC